MQIGESVRTSFEEIRGHKLRSFLTLVGVLFGTIALVAVLSLLQGVHKSVWKGLDDLGFDGVLVVSQKTPSDRVQRAKAHLSRGLRAEDERYVRDSGLVKAFAPVGETRGIVNSGSARRRVQILGVTADFAVAKNRDVAVGRFITDRDQKSAAAVAVVGHKLKERLFGGDDAIGQYVNLEGRRVMIVGVGRKFNTDIVDDREMIREMDAVYIPLSLYEKIFGRKNAVSYILIKATNPEESVAAEGEIRALMTRAHGGINDVEIENVGKEMLRERAQVEEILENWLIVLFAIAGISLVIGGIGIFAVLKISISERLFEIGLRKAIGASDREIFLQFLIESITLSSVGAGIGILCGAVLVSAISSKFPAGLTLSGTGVAVAAGFAIGVGMFAGIFPSLVAAKLTPVEALRS